MCVPLFFTTLSLSAHGDSRPAFAQNYEHLYKANSPPAAPPKSTPGTRGAAPSSYSHYIQSKVVRARERIEAELKVAEEPPTTPPPPSEPGPSDGAQSSS